MQVFNNAQDAWNYAVANGGFAYYRQARYYWSEEILDASYQLIEKRDI